jgi:putative phage-type endonuclease
MLTAENMEARKTGIGASEIPCLAGVPGAWGSPMSVYESKIGAAMPVEENDAMRRGNRMEPHILADLPAATGLTIRPNKLLHRHPDHPFAICTPDGFAFDGHTDGYGNDKAVACVEVKAPMHRGDDWTDPEIDPHGVPDVYQTQAQYQMLVTGLPRCIVAADIFPNADLWVYYLDADPEAQAILLDVAAAFWKRVDESDPPLDDLRASDSERLSRLLHQKSDALAKPTPDEATELLQAAISYDRASKAIRELEEVKALSGAKLKAFIGDKAGADLGSAKVSFRANKPSPEVDWKGVVEELAPPADVINRHTEIRSRARPLRVTFKKEGK